MIRYAGKLFGLGMATAAMIGFSTPAAADITFPVDITGVIYSDNGLPVKVKCQGRDGNTLTMVNGESDVDTLPILNIVPSCELHSAMGVFTDGELFNGEVLDQNVVANTAVNRKGTETFRMFSIQETQASGGGNIEIILDYLARFVVDKSAGLVMPPIGAVRGNIQMVNDSSDELFVGIIKTGRPL